MKLINELLLTKEELESLSIFLKLNENVNQDLLDKFCRNRSYTLVLNEYDIIIYKN